MACLRWPCHKFYLYTQINHSFVVISGAGEQDAWARARHDAFGVRRRALRARAHNAFCFAFCRAFSLAHYYRCIAFAVFAPRIARRAVCAFTHLTYSMNFLCIGARAHCARARFRAILRFFRRARIFKNDIAYASLLLLPVCHCHLIIMVVLPFPFLLLFPFVPCICGGL